MGDVDSTGGAERAVGDSEEVLRAQMAITPHSDSGCVVLEQTQNANVLTHDLKLPQSCFEEVEELTGCTPDRCGECHTEVSDSRKSTYLKSDVHEKCICPVFEEHDCIPDIRAVRNGTVVAVVTVNDRETLREVLQDLKAIDARVSIEWLVTGGNVETMIEINTSEITDKQREALETAKATGYYETPRESSLSELAEELSISESAVSQRLNAAETKLVNSFINGC